MLTKWFGTRSSRSPQRARFFRPQLEYLEGRWAPSGLAPMHDDDNDNGDDDGHHHGPPPPAPVSNDNDISSSVNAHGSFNNSMITNSFNDTINNSIVLMPAQQVAVAGLFSIGFSLASMNPQLGALINDEIALGVDTYLTSPAIAPALPTSVVNSLNADKATLSAAISANPLDHTLFGQVVGTLAFNVTLDALVTAQPKI